jgi:GTP-binding protein
MRLRLRHTVLGLSHELRPALQDGLWSRQVHSRRRFTTNILSPDTLTSPSEYRAQLWATNSFYCVPSSTNSSRPGWAADGPGADAELTRASNFFLGHKSQKLYRARSIFDFPINEYAPEVLVFGASNSGKSSFINSVLNEPLAEVGAKPGKTTAMTAYGVGPPLYELKLAKSVDITRSKDALVPKHSLVLVDTPGYGYGSQQFWGDHILKYIRTRRALRGALLLIDGKRGFKESDRKILQQLGALNMTTQVILTKVDKHNPEGCMEACAELLGALRAIEHNPGIAEWKRGVGWIDKIYWTAAGINPSILKSLHLERNQWKGNAGVMGARYSILRVAGLLSSDDFVTAKLRRDSILKDSKRDREELHRRNTVKGRTKEWPLRFPPIKDQEWHRNNVIWREYKKKIDRDANVDEQSWWDSAADSAQRKSTENHKRGKNSPVSTLEELEAMAAGYLSSEKSKKTERIISKPKGPMDYYAKQEAENPHLLDGPADAAPKETTEAKLNESERIVSFEELDKMMAASGGSQPNTTTTRDDAQGGEPVKAMLGRAATEAGLRPWLAKRLAGRHRRSRRSRTQESHVKDLTVNTDWTYGDAPGPSIAEGGRQPMQDGSDGVVER